MVKQLGRWIVNLDSIFASISLVLIISVSVVGVFMRFVLGEPLQWTEEMTLALFVWFTFLGASVVEKENGHVGIEYFVEKLNPSIKRIADLFKEIVLTFISLFVFVYLGSQLTAQAATRLTPVLRVSYIYIDVAVVLCGIFSAIHIISRIGKMKQQVKINEGQIKGYQTASQEEAKL
ncbi:TRAP transporter small permease [Bacillus sp. ISL-40]|uniref:TRAP transporter small permease n=1 Tax=unclassified Bacillus (in: firmicutes) TaxID=185979 RepID=UPI001BEB1A18|nr:MULTISPECIES: TRAP transporter small permease [unclassified Bacillus (in: firmicutes)]MBT2699962.1 TRAP transporter small permease [Bacillus sp. ISL-40]MBT2722980.1 TRAP transporter small permease [Bacillus sp. ISL-46]MBT2740841.1 TRAP transporter small permease [Bacillus sp. ISL-77]